MTYAISDIHGMYDKYLKMLDLINFNDNDTLFVLGDIVDCGDEPIKVLLDIMNRPNVYPIIGNHDLLALDVLKKLNVDITEENYTTQIDIDTMNKLLDWMNNGGTNTIEQFRKLTNQQRKDILDYIEEFSFAEVIDVGDKTFIMVHAGLGNFRKDKKLSEYTIDELLFTRSNPDIKLFDDEDIYVVSGHTPTLKYTGKPEIIIRNNNIFIDCGACFKKGKLGCICLDTMEEFYVEN